MKITSKWARKVEEEEGMPIVEVIKRERSFGVPDCTIAASFEIDRKAYQAMLDRLRKKGIDV
tara:strand:+ start:1809 stop:1994 length:186 start_codon:yes stop_codon:yes gene_type:complete